MVSPTTASATGERAAPATSLRRAGRRAPRVSVPTLTGGNARAHQPLNTIPTRARLAPNSQRALFLGDATGLDPRRGLCRVCDGLRNSRAGRRRGRGGRWLAAASAAGAAPNARRAPPPRAGPRPGRGTHRAGDADARRLPRSPLLHLAALRARAAQWHQLPELGGGAAARVARAPAEQVGCDQWRPQRD